eukprot:351880-Chlamydomonas_euryale.AAC.4
MHAAHAHAARRPGALDYAARGGRRAFATCPDCSRSHARACEPESGAPRQPQFAARGRKTLATNAVKGFTQTRARGARGGAAPRRSGNMVAGTVYSVTCPGRVGVPVEEGADAGCEGGEVDHHPRGSPAVVAPHAAF